MNTPTLVVSSELNGTLVEQHTMSDMIRLYCGQEKFGDADEVFKKQTSGNASMEEAFKVAGPLTKGLTLQQAIEYVRSEMKFIDGFDAYLSFLKKSGNPFVINSTGYSVTIYSIQSRIAGIHGSIGNILKFASRSSRKCLKEEELHALVTVKTPPTDLHSDTAFEDIVATGEVELGIQDENVKAELLFEYTEHYFPKVQPKQLVHIGDTMGDSGGILGVAQMGGLGIAFNYNDALADFLIGKIHEFPELSTRILLVDRKEDGKANLRHLIPLLEDRMDFM
jgi:2-hydroxy-3-keto-5-methylthiopentenyl-1-phosphate phosphatase